MKMTRIGVLCLFLVLLLAGTSAFSEVTVSMTLTGPIEELAPIMMQLREAGLGESGGEKALKIEMHSAEDLGSQSAEIAQPVPAPQVLALTDAKVEPTTAGVGQSILITVTASDPDHQIDTMTATIDGFPPNDLYDNGTHGDVKAEDGIWSAAVTLNAQYSPGNHSVGIFAFNRNATAVTLNDSDGNPVSLSANTQVTVLP